MNQSTKNPEKPHFGPVFCPNRPKNFFSKIGLRHILSITILHLCAKNQKKTNEPIPRKVGNRKTNERTDKD